YWFELTTRGQIAHGSMPFLGVSAIAGMTDVLAAIRHELEPMLNRRITAMPVVPEGARYATINVNGVEGGQHVDGVQTPSVADSCGAVFDRRFRFEETFEGVKDEVLTIARRTMQAMPEISFELRDLMVVNPVQTPDGSPVIGALDSAIRRVLGSAARLVASP